MLPLTTIILTLVYGIAWGVIWSGLDQLASRFLRQQYEGTPVAQIIVSIITCFVSQSLAVFVVSLVFGLFPSGQLVGIAGMILAAVLFYKIREYRMRGW